MYAELEPLPLVRLREGIDMTHAKYAREHDVELHKAEHALYVVGWKKKDVLKRARYRIVGERQAQWVYWPKGLPAPDEITTVGDEGSKNVAR